MNTTASRVPSASGSASARPTSVAGPGRGRAAARAASSWSIGDLDPDRRAPELGERAHELAGSAADVGDVAGPRAAAARTGPSRSVLSRISHHAAQAIRVRDELAHRSASTPSPPATAAAAGRRSCSCTGSPTPGGPGSSSLPELERHHEVLAVTLAGHAGGPPLPPRSRPRPRWPRGSRRRWTRPGSRRRTSPATRWAAFVALQLAERGRARSVVALAPAGGWGPDDPAQQQTMGFFTEMDELVKAALPHAEQIVSTPEGRRRATLQATVNYEHLPPDLILHMMRGAAGCTGLMDFLAFARDTAGRWIRSGSVPGAGRVGHRGPTAARGPRRPCAIAQELLPGCRLGGDRRLGHCLQLDVPAGGRAADPRRDRPRPDGRPSGLAPTRPGLIAHRSCS